MHSILIGNYSEPRESRSEFEYFKRHVHVTVKVLNSYINRLLYRRSESNPAKC